MGYSGEKSRSTHLHSPIFRAREHARLAFYCGNGQYDIFFDDISVASHGNFTSSSSKRSPAPPAGGGMGTEVEAGIASCQANS